MIYLLVHIYQILDCFNRDLQIIVPRALIIPSAENSVSAVFGKALLEGRREIPNNRTVLRPLTYGNWPADIVEIKVRVTDKLDTIFSACYLSLYLYSTSLILAM